MELWNKKQKRRAKNQDVGFGSWEEANLQKHRKLLRKMKSASSNNPEEDGAAEESAKNGNSDEYLCDHKPSTEAVERMVSDLKQQ